MRKDLQAFAKRDDEGYDEHARRIAQEIGLAVRMQFASHRCPPWRQSERSGSGCDHKHGDCYNVTLTSGGKSLAFAYWNSLRDKAEGKTPTIYDVLSCVGSDVQMSTDPDTIADEFGPMRPSQAIAIAEHAKRLQAFFTSGEITMLGMIQ